MIFRRSFAISFTSVMRLAMSARVNSSGKTILSVGFCGTAGGGGGGGGAASSRTALENPHAIAANAPIARTTPASAASRLPLGLGGRCPT